MFTVDIDNRHKTPYIHRYGNTPFILWGDDNAYCDYLVQLYQRSTTHGAIVKTKADFISGQGLVIEGSLSHEKRSVLEKFMSSVNSFGLNAYHLLDRISLDMEVYGGFCLEVVWSPTSRNIKSIYYVDPSSIRVSRDLNGVYKSQRWTRQQSIYYLAMNHAYSLPQDAVFYDFYNPKKIQVADKLNAQDCRQVFFYRTHSPQNKPYPYPDYLCATTDIEADIEISNYDLNNVKTGWSAGTMVFIPGMIPSEDEKLQLERDLKAKIAGTDNAGQIVLAFGLDNTLEPKVISFRPNDLAEQYLNLKQRVIDNILIGHRVSSPMIFGIKTEGQLGGRSEMAMAYEQFQNTYVTSKQQQIELCFNDLFANVIDDKVSVKIIKNEPLGNDITDEVLIQYLPKDAIKEMAAKRYGIDLNLYKEPETVIEEGHLNPDDDEAILKEFEQLGEVDDTEDDELIYPDNYDNLEESERNLLKKSKFISITNNVQTVIDLFRENKDVELETISRALGMPIETTINFLNQAQKDNLFDFKTNTLKDGKIVVIPVMASLPQKLDPQDDEGAILEVRYKYTGPKDSRNRPFCASMMEMNKIYQRSEINALSTKLRYNVWLRRGGWYTDPNTGVSRPSCRHTWAQKLIKVKK
jgi:hypothetical protein